MAQWFNLTLDTTAPVISRISGLPDYTNDKFTLTLTKSGSETPSYIKIWTNTNSTGATGEPSSWSTYTATPEVTPGTQGTNYVHIKVMDSVGNISAFNSTGYVYDTSAPSQPVVTVPSVTRTATIEISVSATDSGSGIKSYFTTVSTSDGAGWTGTHSGSDTSFSFTLGGGYGTYTVTTTATDNAGNTSIAGTAQIVYGQAQVLISVPSQLSSTSTNATLTGDSSIASVAIYDGDPAGSGTELVTFTWPNQTSVITPVVPITILSGDGTHTLYAVFTDKEGGTQTVHTTTVLDTTGPVINTFTATGSGTSAIISSNSGYNTVTLKSTASDATTSVSKYQVTVATSAKSASWSETANTGNLTLSKTYADIIALLGVTELASGTVLSFTIKWVDILGNSTTSSAKTITIDRAAPTYSGYQISGHPLVAGFFGGPTPSRPTIKFSVSDAITNSVDWQVFLATSTTGTTGICSTSGSTTGSQTYTPGTELSSSGTYYVRLKLTDAVGNTATSTLGSFVYDVTAPSTLTFNNATNYYVNDRSQTITGISATDALAGAYQYRVYGDIVSSTSSTTKITQSAASWKALTSSVGVILYNADGQHSISIDVRDKSGNIKTTTNSNWIFLDTTDPTATCVSKFANYSSTASGNIGITVTDSTAVTYSISGGDLAKTYTGTLTSGSENIIPVTISSTTSKDVSCTIVLTDAAGNTFTKELFLCYYDNSDPTIVVNQPDFNIVSLQHTARQTNSNKYNDESIFVWTSTEILQAYKVCVWETNQTASGATAIPTTNGSENMSESGLAISDNCKGRTSKIKGADLKTVVTNDGTYVIIVYGQDLSGRWSAVYTG